MTVITCMWQIDKFRKDNIQESSMDKYVVEKNAMSAPGVSIKILICYECYKYCLFFFVVTNFLVMYEKRDLLFFTQHIF